MMLNDRSRQNLSRKASLSGMLSVACLLPLAAMWLLAQDKAKDLSGTIYDVSGAAVAGARVTVRDQTGKLIAVTESDSTGKFSFKGLLGSGYQLQAAKPGFEPYTLSHILLPSSEQRITLRLPEVIEGMDVVAKNPGKSTAAKAVGPGRVHLGGDIEAAKLLTRIEPVYPLEARAAGIEGTVLLHAVIGMNGTPMSVEVINSQDPQLTRAALEAVRRWRYRPTLLNGSPIEVDTTISINFKLSS